MEKVIIDNYLTPSHPTAFSGIQNVYKFYNGKVPIDKIKEILSKIDSYTLHKQYKKLDTNINYVNQLREQFQMDIAHVDHLAEYNDGYKYLLICIDSFSKFAFVRPMKYKSGFLTLENFKSIIMQANIKPKILLVDRGKEFTNIAFDKYCRENGIKLIHNYTSVHAPMAERFIGTLKGIMSKYMTSKNTKRYIDVLQDLVKTYNLRKHNTIKMSPFEGEKPSSGLKIREALSKIKIKVTRREPKLKIGQKVRISLEKTKFSRGHHIKSTHEIFTIYEISTKKPIPLYFIQDEKGEKIKGGFYSYELTPII